MRSLMLSLTQHFFAAADSNPLLLLEALFERKPHENNQINNHYEDDLHPSQRYTPKPRKPRRKAGALREKLWCE